MNARALFWLFAEVLPAVEPWLALVDVSRRGAWERLGYE